jgi:hypothetical protein
VQLIHDKEKFAELYDQALTADIFSGTLRHREIAARIHETRALEASVADLDNF